MNLLRHLYDLKLYENDRENGIIIVLLVDGHGGCFDLGLLKYICDENHKWTVNIIVVGWRLNRIERNIQKASC